MADLEVPVEAEAPEAPVAESHESEPSTDIDYSKLSEDDILDGAFEKSPAEEEPAAEDAEAAEATAPAEAKPVADTKTATPAPKEEHEEQVEDIEPESLAKLYANPELKTKLEAIFKDHPEVRRAWFRSGQIGDLFGTVAEAREIRSLFPTMDTAKQASNAASVLATMESTYLQDPTTFASSLANGNPRAFAALVASSREVLYSKNPDAYRLTIGEPVAQEGLANCEEWAAEQGDEPFLAAIAIMRDRLGLAGAGAPKGGRQEPHPAEVELSRLRADASRMREQASVAFESSVHSGYWDALRSSVDKIVGTPANMSEKAVLKLKSEVFDAVADRVASQANLQPIFENLTRSGDMSEANRNKAVEYLMGYARQVLGPIARERITEWTKDILRANAAEAKQVTAQTKKKDVGSGNGTTRPAAPSQGRLPNGRFDYRKYSDDDIIEGRF